jgi:hypothetical protein
MTRVASRGSETYITTGHHLLGNVFNASLVLGLTAAVTDGIHRL